MGPLHSGASTWAFRETSWPMAAPGLGSGEGSRVPGSVLRSTWPGPGEQVQQQQQPFRNRLVSESALFSEK